MTASVFVLNLKRTRFIRKNVAGNFPETGWSAYGLFRAHRYRLDLSEVKRVEVTSCLTPVHHPAAWSSLAPGRVSVAALTLRN